MSKNNTLWLTELSFHLCVFSFLRFLICGCRTPFWQHIFAWSMQSSECMSWGCTFTWLWYKRFWHLEILMQYCAKINTSQRHGAHQCFSFLIFNYLFFSLADIRFLDTIQKTKNWSKVLSHHSICCFSKVVMTIYLSVSKIQPENIGNMYTI